LLGMDVESAYRFRRCKKTTNSKDLVDKRVNKKKVDKFTDPTGRYRFDFRNRKITDLMLVDTNSMNMYTVGLC
jgi:hypothetical protein